MDQIMKQARLMKAAPDEGEMALVNAQALRELGAEEVFTFRLAACNNQVDRDLERFSDAALEGLAEKFVGRPVLMDHCGSMPPAWSPCRRRRAGNSWCSGAICPG